MLGYLGAAVFFGALSLMTVIGMCMGTAIGCASQDISTRYAALLYGTTSVLGVAAGATAQVGTGVALEMFDRDFAPIFGVTALVEFIGLAAWWLWWSSDERIFE